MKSLKKRYLSKDPITRCLEYAVLSFIPIVLTMLIIKLLSCIKFGNQMKYNGKIKEYFCEHCFKSSQFKSDIIRCEKECACDLHDPTFKIGHIGDIIKYCSKCRKVIDHVWINDELTECQMESIINIIKGL